MLGAPYEGVPVARTGAARWRRVIMPLVVLPFLVLMNEEQYVGRHTSGVFGNGLLATLTVLGALMAIVVIPLEIWGS